MVLSPDEQHIHTGDTHSTVPASDPDSIDSDNTRSQMSVEESFISIINQLSGESKVMECHKYQLICNGEPNGVPACMSLFSLLLGRY